jgi:hypothetical protein
MSFSLRTWILCAVGFITLGLPSAVSQASADPVTLSGSVVVFSQSPRFGGADFQLSGPHGFKFDATGEGFLDTCAPFLDPGDTCVGGIGPAGGTFGGFVGDATVNGRDLTFNPLRSDNATGQISVGGTVNAPSHATGDVQFIFPASLDGHVHFREFPEGGEEFNLDVDLSGSGIGTLKAFAFTRDGETVYSIGSLRFDFGQSAATPEPSSLILLGSGLAVAWSRRRRRASAEA